ncbi:DMT family transporter [Microcoleus sp. FACHB-SPT15]|uniref:DMT family transporter n=1 Tax=Microcoleus sp. FACHB-SPT15 TaxID=2692830 RepID=UPI00177AE6B4|nr:DMT family transporter [Microcoleus sp. FACHB-SPT15]MBD1808323.1 DMT family transporter [Microcoleus sp. FACHB-SPT15]
MRILDQPLKWQVGLILVAGVFAVSTAAIFIRLAIASAGVSGVGFSLFVSASRLAIASLLLLPAWRNLQPSQLSPGALRYAIAAGICLAVHFGTWITSLSFTSIAVSTTLVTTNPVWVALFSWLWFKEKPTKLTILGIGVAFMGGVLIASGDVGVVSAATNPLLGNFLALAGAWMASLYFLLGREAQRRGLGIGSYVVVAYSTGALVLLPLPLIFGTNYSGYPVAVYLYILLMAVASQVVGHTTLNWSVRWISPTLVTLAILFEPVSSSFLGYLIFNEVPGLLVLVGAIVLLGGVAIAVFGAREKSTS